jgi:hypothetical protein
MDILEIKREMIEVKSKLDDIRGHLWPREKE